MRIQLAADPRSVSRARAAVKKFLAGTPASTRSDDAVLAVSELVTNAIQAGARSVELEVTVSTRSFVLRVTDDAEGWPTARRPSEESENGRGLRIVEGLADRWKVQRTKAGKKVVATFRL